MVKRINWSLFEPKGNELCANVLLNHGFAGAKNNNFVHLCISRAFPTRYGQRTGKGKKPAASRQIPTAVSTKMVEFNFCLCRSSDRTLLERLWKCICTKLLFFAPANPWFNNTFAHSSFPFGSNNDQLILFTIKSYQNKSLYEMVDMLLWLRCETWQVNRVKKWTDSYHNETSPVDTYINTKIFCITSLLQLYVCIMYVGIIIMNNTVNWIPKNDRCQPLPQQVSPQIWQDTGLHLLPKAGPTGSCCCCCVDQWWLMVVTCVTSRWLCGLSSP